MSDNTKNDLLVVLEVNKMMYPVWCLIILLCKLDIASARLFSEKQVVDYVHRLVGERIRNRIHGS